jgi:hypothetical protein
MSTFFVFLQIHIVVSVVVAVAMWRCLRRSARPIIEQNCRRLDGTYSQRRKLIELQSLEHAGLSIVKALLFLFAVTALLGMAIFALIFMQFDRLELATPNSEVVSPTFDQSVVDFLNEWQWQLLTTYIVISLFIFPSCLSYAYKHALQKYKSHANARFHQYYQQEWWNASEVAKKKLTTGHHSSAGPEANHFACETPQVGE